MKKLRKTNGITLVALIITIVVMLILVTVTLRVVVNSDIIGIAEQTGEKMKTEYEKEGDMSEIEINEKKYEKIEDYIAKKEKIEEVHDWQYTDATRAAVRCECEKCKVDENGDGKGRTINIGAELSSYTAGPEGTQWVVFGVQNSNASATNTTNETLLISTLAPSTETLTVQWPTNAWNNIEIINTKCKEIYGTEARGMTIEDVNNTVGYEATGAMYMGADYKIQLLDGFDTTHKELLVDVYGICEEDEYDTTTESFKVPIEGTEIGEYPIDGYGYTINSVYATEVGVPVLSDEIDGKVKALVFGEDGTSAGYWLASQGIMGYGQLVWGTGCIYNGVASNCWGNEWYTDLPLSLGFRPVVPLISVIPETGEVLVGDISV